MQPDADDEVRFCITIGAEDVLALRLERAVWGYRSYGMRSDVGDAVLDIILIDELKKGSGWDQIQSALLQLARVSAFQEADRAEVQKVARTAVAQAAGWQGEGAKVTVSVTPPDYMKERTVLSCHVVVSQFGQQLQPRLPAAVEPAVGCAPVTCMAEVIGPAAECILQRSIIYTASPMSHLTPQRLFLVLAAAPRGAAAAAVGYQQGRREAG